MNKSENLIKIKKEDAIDILDRIIGFINNCDNKASAMLGVFGVLLTILFSNEGVAEIKNIIKVAINNNKCYGILYSAFLSGAGIIFAFGIFKLIQVLFPKTDCNSLKQEDIECDSKIFFGSICKNPTYKQYKLKLQECSEDEYLNDIISQIYINAIICNKKFENYKTGVITTIIGFLSFLIVWGIGTLVY